MPLILPDHAMKRRSAFTLMEMLVVIALVMILIAMMMPTLSFMRAEARNIVCRSRIRQLGMFAIATTNDLGGRMPFDEENYGGHLPWLWDMPKNIRDGFVGNGFLVDNFYCPFNEWQNQPSLWEFSWYTVTGYYVLWDMTGSQPSLPLRTGAGLHKGYVWEAAALGEPSETELVTDATISQGYDFNEVWGGWSKPHHTSHRRRFEPLGGNIMYSDGHADWRNFEDMDLQSPNPQQWF